jgi:PilZ domain-containing protein
MLSKRNVRLMDLSTTGARVEHAFPLSLGKRARFEFLCNGDRLCLQAEVVRSRLARVSAAERVFCSGLRFVEDEDHELWGLIVSMAVERLGQT